MKPQPDKRALRAYLPALVMLAVFLAVGVTLWLALEDLFYLANFAYIGIALAFALRDNRAFCKYVCPVSLLMKPAARFARICVTCDAERCVSCGRCRKVCPMNVDMLDSARSRKNATECILCAECINACPKGALKL